MGGDALQFQNQRKSKNVDSHLIVTPAIFKPGSTAFKSMDSRQKISGMTKKGVTPEWFYEESK